MQDINDFGHPAIEGLSKEFSPIISTWIENSSDKVAHRRKELEEEEGSGDEALENEADEGEEPRDVEEQP